MYYELNNDLLATTSEEIMAAVDKRVADIRKFGRLNPDLYRKMSHSSSSNISGFGDIRLSYSWIGQTYDQLKIRILKIKNIPVEYYRAGLYIRYT